MSRIPYRLWIILLLLFSLASRPPASAITQAPAQTAFGSGLQICQPPLQPVSLSNPSTVTDCTQAGLQAALDAGGQITFDCPTQPFTIPLSSQLELSIQTDTVLDGGGVVTLDGQSQTRILHKGWHDPETVGTVNVTLQNIRLINGKAPSGDSTGDHSGAAISAGHPGTRLHVINATFENNTTTDVHTTDNQGGAIFVHNAYETVISGSEFRDNAAGNGGALGGIATGLVIFNSRFTGNQALDDTSGGIVRGYGGAIHLDGVTNSYNPDSNKRVHVCGSLFEDNQARRGGGAISSVVSDNQGTKLTVEQSTFTRNAAHYGQGGALYHIEDDHAGGTAEDNIEIRQTTFSSNQALRQGGAVWIYVLGRGRVANCTLAHNTTTAPINTVGQGGGMVITLGVIDVVNTTFAYNHAAYQAGALHGGGGDDPQRVITLANTIFYSNTLNQQSEPSSTEWQGYHTNRPMNDGGQNIQHPRYKPVWGNDHNNNITADPIYADPLLGALADNGGPNETMALQAGSPAIDAGNPAACPGRDQRGYTRAGPCDVGPYEFDGAPFIPETFLYLPVTVKYSHAKLFFPLHTESEPFPMRVLFLNQPTVGHANTLLNIALQMRSEQHTVSFLMPGFRHTGSRFKFLKAATRVPEIVAAHGIPVDLIRPPVRVLLQALRLPHSQGYAEIKLALELFSRGAYYYTRHVWAEVERLRPDVMVADFAFFPPHLVGELLNIPCVVVYHSGLPFRGKMVPPFGSGLPIEEQTPAWGEYVQQEQKLLERLDRRINTARAKIGLSPMPTGTLHTPYSRWLNLVTSVEAIEAPRDNLGRNTLFIGPCFAQRQTLENDFPFKRLRADRYKVYVSLGTVFNNKPDVFRKITSALDNPEFQVIVSAGGAYEKLSQSHLPENVLLFERVPQIALLPKVDLVIGHGGNNSTNETLAAGKPLIILPVGGEQGDNASRVEYLDVGLRVDIQQFDATEIYHKVQTIRTTPGFQARAHALQQAIAKTDGPFSASTCIQWVARHRQPMLRPQGFPLTVTRENLPELIGCQPVQKTQFTRDRIPQ